jgi:hypothetical protein
MLTAPQKAQIKSALPSSAYKILAATPARVYASTGDEWRWIGIEGALVLAQKKGRGPGFEIVDLKVRML